MTEKQSLNAFGTLPAPKDAAPSTAMGKKRVVKQLRDHEPTKPEKPAEPEYISVTGIKLQYNVTDKFVKLLGEPDMEGENPHYKSAAPTKLYRRKRVADFVEKMKLENPAFMERMAKRQSKAAKAVETKKASMKALVAELVASLVIQPYDAAKIPGLTMQQHYLHQIDIHGDCDDDSFEPGFGACVAYIRHQLTDYEDVLERIRGRVGSQGAYETIKTTLNQMIETDYTEKGGDNNE